MRSTHDADFITDENGNVLGISLGADYCAEHEWGIKGLQQAFGLCEGKPQRGEPLGVDRRTVQKIPAKGLHFRSFGDFHFMYYYQQWGNEEKELDKKQLESLMDGACYRTEAKPCAAWDERSFAVRVKGQQQMEMLFGIFNAIRAKNATIFLGGGGVFKNAGLILAIRDKIPSQFVKLQAEKDTETIELEEATVATGIREVLEKAGKRYFALSPRFDNEKKLTFWLNPMEQDENNFGWFTVEDLMEWSEGKGKIPKSDEQLRKEAEDRKRYR